MKKNKIKNNKLASLTKGICLALSLLPCAGTVAYGSDAIAIVQQAGIITVTGTVKDATGEPIPGANIMVKGGSEGAITDVDGKFTLPNINPKAILTISFIGYQPQDVALNGRKIIQVVLNEDTEMLDEVVVVGYGKQKRVNMSGAVDAVSSKTLENRSLANAGLGLQGAVPNLNITVSDGNANSSPKYNIRGIGSINKDSADPLILVDNIPVTSGEFSRMNANDIENISVLKDASSAAIYGARAAFGVILITTKSAKTEKVSVAVNAYYSSRRVTRLPEHELDPYTVMESQNQARTYSFYTEEQMAEAKKRAGNSSLPSVIVDPSDPNRWAYYGKTDWMKETYSETAPSYTVNFNIAQRTKKVGYYLSGEYYRQDGMLRYGTDIYDRYNMRGKVDFQITDWLNISNNTSFAYRTYDKPNTDMESLFHEVNRRSTLDVVKNPDGTFTKSGSLLSMLENGGRSFNDSREFSTTFAATIDLLKDVWQIKADATFRRDSERTRRSSVPYTYRQGPGMEIEQNTTSSSARNDAGFYDNNIFNVYTDFHKTFAERHYVQALVGFNQENMRSNTFWVSRDGLISPSFPTIALATGNYGGTEDIKEWSTRGAFFRLNYVFNNRYIVEFNGRYDGTSRFRKNDRYGFFPSASVAWNVTEEKFMESIKEKTGLNTLKLRGSYGSLGNQNVDTYAFSPQMKSEESGWILDGKKPLQVIMPGIVSNSLTWEQVRTINGGIDLGFLNNRLTAGFDYYVRYTEGMLTQGKKLPNVLGTNEAQENAADLKTKGWELSLAWRDQFNLAGSPFSYGVRFILSDSRSFITKFDNYTNAKDKNGNEILDKNGKNVKTSTWRGSDKYYVGQELGEIWGLTTEGFFQNEEELKNHANQTAVGSDDTNYLFYVGDLKFKDLDGDGKVDWGDGTLNNPGDFRKIGNTSMRLPYSIDLDASWKGFDLRVFLQGVGKRDWYAGGNNHYFWGIYAQPWTNVQKVNLDRWSPETPNGYFPRVKPYVAEDTGSELSCPQTRYLQDASYLRLKNVTLGYTLPKAWLGKAGIERVRFYISGENLCELQHLKVNLDPEALDSNSKTYPLQRSFTFGVNLNF